MGKTAQAWPACQSHVSLSVCPLEGLGSGGSPGAPILSLRSPACVWGNPGCTGPIRGLGSVSGPHGEGCGTSWGAGLGLPQPSPPSLAGLLPRRAACGISTPAAPSDLQRDQRHCPPHLGHRLQVSAALGQDSMVCGSAGEPAPGDRADGRLAGALQHPGDPAAPAHSLASSPTQSPAPGALELCGGSPAEPPRPSCGLGSVPSPDRHARCVRVCTSEASSRVCYFSKD